MSGKLETKQFLSKHDMSTCGQLLFFNQESTFDYYERQLQDNIHEILRKFPALDRAKVRTLLQEIDNNYDVAVKLLKAEETRCSSIVEEKRTEPKATVRSNKDEEISFLRQSFLKLYQKTQGMAKEIQELKGKLEKKENENEKLKYTNRLLLEREYSRNYFEDNAPIY